MTLSLNQMAEAARALDGPLFADVPGDLAVSFEFFPPKTPAMHDALWQAVETLVPLNPRFFSVTYGAGGTTRERTHATVARIAAETPVPAAAHLTCVNATAEELDVIADEYWHAGVRHIVALRGDPPGGEASFTPVAGGHASAADLVKALRKRHPFEISVSCYPETHPEAPSPTADLEALKAKHDAGASRAISQFFFEPDTFFRFRDKVAAAGLDVELVPGILPVTNFANLTRMAAGCNTNVPAWMAKLFAGLDDKPAARQLVAATVAAELARRLYAGGVRHFHFYTLNRAELSYAICHLLGVRPAEVLAA
ncbi:methylenetetrahydrofolate reductase [NAD(P)H] [Sandarakinorhabdus sp.]|uniref:methylenetetrahydrofolate reductase [NAD(P)H] n=1 Tax=Sandarakinorhabdus sp. TaxID=1916663 RepID=UPI003F71454F